MNKFLCIALLACASLPLQAFSIKTVVNNSLQDAFIIAYNRPKIAEPTDLTKSFIGYEDAVSPLESSVYLLTRASIARKTPATGPITISDDKEIIISTGKGCTNLKFNPRTLSAIDSIDALIICPDGTLNLLKDGVLL